MAPEPDALEERLKIVREEFDRAFAQPERTEKEAVEELLTLRLHGDPYALRMRDLAGLLRDQPVSPVCSQAPTLSGIAGIQNGIVAVHGLAALMGYARTETACKWLALCRRNPRSEIVGLAFEEMLDWVQVPLADMRPHADETRPHVAGLVQNAGTALYVIGIPSILDALLGKGAE